MIALPQAALVLFALAVTTAAAPAPRSGRTHRYHGYHGAKPWTMTWALPAAGSSTSLATEAAASTEIVLPTTSIAVPTPSTTESATVEAVETDSAEPSTSTVLQTITSTQFVDAIPTTSTTISTTPATTIATTTSAAATTSTTSSAAATTTAASGTSALSADQIEYLTYHNNVRKQHGATDLTWSADLEAAAKIWASKCVFQHSGGQVGPYGENLFAGSGTGFTIKDAVTSWTDEVSAYDSSNPVPSHYTQVVWKGTTQVGCAKVFCPGIFPEYGGGEFTVCEYNPSGNVIGQFAKNVQ